MRITLNLNNAGLTVRVHGHRPVDQVEVNIVQPQILQALVQSLFHTVVPCAPELGGHEEFLSLDNSRLDGRLDTLANFSFVAVGESGINVSVSNGDGMGHGLFDLSRT